VDCQSEYGASYLIDGFYGEVRVSVVEFDGTQSDPYHADGVSFLFPITIPLTRTFNIVAPEGVTVLIDGVMTPSGIAVDSQITPLIFAGVIEPAEVPVRLLRYEFGQSGYYAEPVVSAVDAQGRALLPEISADGEIFFDTGFSEEYKELHSDAVEEFIRAYVVFAANIGGNFDGNLAALNNHVLRGSDLHRRLQGTRSSMDWVGGTSVSFNSLEIDNFRPFGDNYFSCEVNYSITSSYTSGRRVAEGSFEVLFVLSGGRWVAVNMLVH